MKKLKFERKETKKHHSSGITLIALVITIIVLLILAGISISMLAGDNSIVQKATDAKTYTNRTRVVEQAKIDVLGYQAENKNGILEEAQLKAVLEKYFINSEIPENFPSDLSTLELTTQNKYGTYKINVSEIYNGSFGTTSDLSIDDIMSLGEYIGFFNEDEFMGKYENNYYRVNIRNNSVTKIEMKNYFLIEEIVNESVDNRVILYGNEVETWTDFINSEYNSSYGFFSDDNFVSKGDSWWLRYQSGWVTINDSLINGAIYGWGMN